MIINCNGSAACDATLIYVFPGLGCITAILLYSSPLPAIFKIRKSQRLILFNPLPFPLQISTTLAWTLYSFLLVVRSLSLLWLYQGLLCILPKRCRFTSWSLLHIDPHTSRFHGSKRADGSIWNYRNWVCFTCLVVIIHWIRWRLFADIATWNHWCLSSSCILRVSYNSHKGNN